MANYFCTDSVEEQVDYLTDKVKDLKNSKLDKAAIVQGVGTGIDVVMSQKSVTDTINENLQTINTEVNGKLTKPTNPSAESAVTMLADGTVGTKLLSEIGGGGKLYQHDYTITGTGEGNYVYCTTYKRSNTPLTIQEVISLFSSQSTTGKVVSVGVVTNYTNGGTGYFQNVSSPDTYDVYKNGVDAEFDISASSNMTYNIVEV